MTVRQCRYTSLPWGATSLLDDHRELEPPDPIPNSEVKRFLADGSVGLPHVRVGHRQAFILKPWSVLVRVFLCLLFRKWKESGDRRNEGNYAQDVKLFLIRVWVHLLKSWFSSLISNSACGLCLRGYNARLACRKRQWRVFVVLIYPVFGCSLLLISN